MYTPINVNVELPRDFLIYPLLPLRVYLSLGPGITPMFWCIFTCGVMVQLSGFCAISGFILRAV